MRELAFVIHPDKSVLIPSQIIDFPRFVMSSKHLIILCVINWWKYIYIYIYKNFTCCLHSYQVSIRELARIIGNVFVASFPAVTFGPLHNRHLVRDKIKGLKYHKGNFERKISISSIWNTLGWELPMVHPHLKVSKGRN